MLKTWLNKINALLPLFTLILVFLALFGGNNSLPEQDLLDLDYGKTSVLEGFSQENEVSNGTGSDIEASKIEVLKLEDSRDFEAPSDFKVKTKSFEEPLAEMSFNTNRSIGNSSGAVSYLKFENVPAQISPNQNVTFSLSAYDLNDQIVNNYTGTVRFSIVGANANFVKLPPDYTFTPQDLGTHTFSLASFFSQTGVYEIEARDSNNPTIFAKYTFVVTQQSPSLQAAGTLKMLTPLPGVYSNNVQVVSGTAKPGAQLKILNNNLEIGSALADATGRFNFTTSRLSDGKNSIYVAEVNDVGTILEASDVVEFEVDTSTAEIDQVLIEPSGSVNAGETVTVKVFVNEPLAQATLLFEDNIYQMVNSNQGFYVTNFPAPIAFGQYPLTFLLVDQLGNEQRYESKANLTVGVAPVAIKPRPAQVQNLTARASDSKVTLSWSPLDPVNSDIRGYRVYYGVSPTQLSEVVDTFGSQATWYVPNLKNGTQYYFAVVGIDLSGLSSETFSNIVSSIPGGAYIGAPDSPEAQNAIAELERDPSEAGPGVLALLFSSGALGFLFNRKKKTC